MAKALQCPSCGATTRLDAVPASGAVRCDSCGQSMKVPPGLGRKGRSGEGGRGGDAAPAPARSSGSDPAPGAAPPAPPRRSRGRAPAGADAGAAAAAAPAVGGTAVIPPSAAPARPVVTSSPPPMRSGGPVGALSRDDGGGRDALPLVLRVGAWVLALPLGLLIVGIPARQLGYLSSQKLLDVIVKRDLGRFLPIVVVIALWALVSAVLVTVFVEGGRRWMLRRRKQSAR